MQAVCEECEIIKSYPPPKRRCFTCARKQNALDSGHVHITDTVANTIVHFTPPGPVVSTPWTWDSYLVDRILDYVSTEMRYTQQEIAAGVNPQRTRAALRGVNKRYRDRYPAIRRPLKFTVEGLNEAAHIVAQRDCIFKDYKRVVRIRLCRLCGMRERHCGARVEPYVLIRRWSRPFAVLCQYCALDSKIKPV